MPARTPYRPSQIYVDEKQENLMPALKKWSKDGVGYGVKLLGIEAFREVKWGEHYIGGLSTDAGLIAGGKFTWRNACGYIPKGPRLILKVEQIQQR